MTDIRKASSKELASTQGSDSETIKLDIHTEDDVYGCYVTTVFKEKRLTYLEVRLDGTWNDESRGYVESSCRQGYALVRSGVWTCEQLAKFWMNYNFPPQGSCPQLETIAKSPLDAVAKLLLRRLKEKGIIK